MKNTLFFCLLAISTALSLQSCSHNSDNSTPGDGTCPNGCPIGAICDSTTCNCPSGQYANGNACFDIPTGYSEALAPNEPCGFDKFIFKVTALSPQIYTYPEPNADIATMDHGTINIYYRVNEIEGDTFFCNPIWTFITPCVTGTDTLYPQWTGRYTLDKDSLDLIIHWREYSWDNTGAIHRTVTYKCKNNN